MIDWTISIGSIVTILTVLVGIVGFVMTVHNRVDALSRRMGSLEEGIRKLVDVLIVQGRQDERMNSIDGRMLAQGARLDDLSRQIDRLFEPRGEDS